MCRFFETIRIADGVPQNLSRHEERMALTGKTFHGGMNRISLISHIKVPPDFTKGIVRCRVVYSKEIESVDYSFYHPATITTLMLVPCDTVDYSYKYADRSRIEELYDLRDGCDEIIIVKEGLLTDASMANLIFFDGKDWFTPEKPLLAGTCRESLLSEGLITEKKITPDDLGKFVGVKLINAMRYPGESPLIPGSQIRKKSTFAKKR